MMAGPNAGGGGPAQFPEIYAARQATNEEAAIYFAAAIAGLIGVVTIFHLVRVLGRKASLASAPTVAASPFFYASRCAQVPSEAYLSLHIFFFFFFFFFLFLANYKGFIHSLEHSGC